MFEQLKNTSNQIQVQAIFMPKILNGPKFSYNWRILDFCSKCTAYYFKILLL